jgi:calcium-dependent protein kinase
MAKIFKAIDKNGDGKLSKMFDAVDIDKSGFIDYSEFVVASMNEKQLLTDEKLLSAFKMFDKVSSY